MKTIIHALQLFSLALAFAVASVSADEEIPLCISTLRDLCDLDSSIYSSCGDCARSNQSELLEAGCTVELVTRVCGAMATTGAGEISTCRDELSTVCPVSEYRGSRDCFECVQSNIDKVQDFGCTVSIVTQLCEDRESSIPVAVPETILPTGATESNPLRVFIQSGQSGCVGQASVTMMNEDPSYDELTGVLEGVWFAGLKQGNTKTGTDQSHFFMNQMLAGEASKNDALMGPEVAIGKRLYDADPSGAPVLVVKYCWGGSNLAVQWNPDSPMNKWDKEQDDGTAEWLLETTTTDVSGGADLGDKSHLYANMIYTVRRSLELLEEANIPYKLSGMFWLQGAADSKRSTWREYGDDTIAFFEAVRTELNEPFLPIVDDGSTHTNIQTGKVYAASVIEGCNSVVTNLGLASPDPEDTECVITPSNPCSGSSFLNYDLLNYYGYDPVLDTAPEFAFLKPPGATNKTFYWFRSFPNNLHMEYEGKILQGRMMANAYIRAFTNDELKEEWLLDDPQVMFPKVSCDPTVNDGKPNADNICWMDLREEADQAEATCSEPKTSDTVIMTMIDIGKDIDDSSTGIVGTNLSSGSSNTITGRYMMMALSSFPAFLAFFVM